ncbi:MAG: hypothetical protein V1809_08850 [Planctomycetota bacterium]
MFSIKSLEEAKPLDEFCLTVKDEEAKTQYEEACAYDLELYPDGALAVKGRGAVPISDSALDDLAGFVKVPAPFLSNCDSELRAHIFNWRLRRTEPEKIPIQIVYREDRVDRILETELISTHRYPILDTVSNAIPSDIQRDGLRVLPYAWNGHFDISIVTRERQSEPQKGDVVAFGINVSDGSDGSIQIHGATYRLACSNGAVTRVCDGNKHRLRRPLNKPGREKEYFKKLSSFVVEAWNGWESHARELEALTRESVDRDRMEAIRGRLRQAPFFLSKKNIDRVFAQLDREIAGSGGIPGTSFRMYDLWNAISAVGTHTENLSRVDANRLRLGAGELTRGSSRICNVCRRAITS